MALTEKPVVIWVEGIISSGKSRLVGLLSTFLNLRPIFEETEGNKLLEAFYGNQKEFAFGFQMSMLDVRAEQHDLAIAEGRAGKLYRGAMIDRSLPGDRCFKQLHVKYGNIHPLLGEVYDRSYRRIVSRLPLPDMILYLDVTPETAFRRMQTRGRDIEAGVPMSYLRDLRGEYEDLISRIEKGEEYWARGFKVARWNWDVDDQPIEPIAAMISEKLGLPKLVPAR